MIQANELRIGNLIYDFGMVCTVTPLIISRLADIENAGKVCINWAPIPLTEDILLKCGFEIEKHYDSKYELNHGQYIFVIDFLTFLKIYIKGVDECLFFDEAVNGLHQLQNLYFALTNEELTIN